MGQNTKFRIFISSLICLFRFLMKNYCLHFFSQIWSSSYRFWGQRWLSCRSTLLNDIPSILNLSISTLIKDIEECFICEKIFSHPKPGEFNITLGLKSWILLSIQISIFQNKFNVLLNFRHISVIQNTGRILEKLAL